jgi:hypothetical protein
VETVEWGLWVEPENPDALTLYHDPDRRERLGRSGREYVQARYTPAGRGPAVRIAAGESSWIVISQTVTGSDR